MNANPSPPVSIFAFNFLCLRCCHMQRYTHTYPLFTTRSYYGSNILILFSLSPPPPAAQSIPTDQPRSFLQPLRQTQRLPLPQGDRQGQLRQGAARAPPHRRPVLRRQSLTEEGHPQEEGGKRTKDEHKCTRHKRRLRVDIANPLALCPPQEKHIMSERNVLLKNVKHPFLVGLHYSFQTADKLYFILDYINGGEVS